MSNINVVSCTPDEAKEIVRRVIAMPVAVRPTVMLHAEPGAGKTAIVHALCMELYGRKPIVVHAATHEPSDIKGLPDLDREARKVSWIKPDFLPREGEGILFLDEITSGRRDVLAALYPIVHERRIDDLAISDGYAIVCAGNDVADGAIANPMGTALADRMLHLLIVATPESFVDHWGPKGMAPAILATVVQMPHLFTDNARRIAEDLMVAPTSRSWERAWRIMEEFDVEAAVKAAADAAERGGRRRVARQDARKVAERMLSIALSGCIGQEAAGQLMLTMADIEECVDPKVLMGMDLYDARKKLPRTLRSGVALAFSLASICTTAKEIVKGCAIMALVAQAREAGDIPDASEGIAMSGREIAAFGIERLLFKAEQLKIAEEVLSDVDSPGADLLQEYVADVADRYEAIGPEAQGSRAAA